ncbi:MAG: GNAT family N-acetyltransferase [Lachnospiraceae bacterium]|nr:GNAT family N-acetyltransferase [Lachnospiraceae bacterium]
MRYIRINKKHIKEFSAIADVDDLRCIGQLDDDMAAFGAIDMKDGERIIAGVIIYQFIYEEDEKPRVDIRWIHVVEEYRNQGVGTMLFKSTLKNIPKDEIYSSSVVFFQNNNAPVLISFFESMGYRIYHHTLYEMYSTVKRICDVPAIWDDEVQNKTVTIEKLHIKDMNTLRDNTPFLWYEDLEKINIENLEPYISNAYVDQYGALKGLLLVRKRLGGALEPVFYRAVDNNKDIMRSLFYATVLRTKKRYDGSTVVYAKVNRKEHRAMINRIYSDIHPIKAWRGEHERIN